MHNPGFIRHKYYFEVNYYNVCNKIFAIKHSNYNILKKTIRIKKKKRICIHCGIIVKEENLILTRLNR